MRLEGAIHRVRVRSAREDTPALRLCLTRQLGGTDLRLPGVPPSALLLVRALPDPLPGRLSTHPAAFGIDGHWERALRQRLETLHGTAARPRDGRIARGAEAVLFADESEMLACLALHMATAGTPWPWWGRSLARYARIDSLHALLAGNVERVPAVFTTLARWHAEAPVAAALPEAAAAALIEALARAMYSPLRLDAPPASSPGALAAVPSPTAARIPAPHPAGPEHPQRGGDPATTDIAGTEPGPAAPAPWRDAWRPAPGAVLTRRQQILVGFALTLHRTPARGRSPRFAREVWEWLRRAADAAPPAAAAVVPPPAVPERLTPSAEEPAPRARPAPPAPPSIEPSPPAARRPAPIRRRPPGREPQPRPRAPPEPAATRPRRPVAETSPSLVVEEIPAAPVRDEADSVRDWGEAGVETALGGVLYLVNLMEHLDLPECFEADCALASAVGAFGTLEAIARALLGPLPPELEDDPLWTLLAHLDQRAAGEAPGAEGLTVDTLGLPPRWVGGGAELPRPLRWAAREGTLYIWAESAYPVVRAGLAGGGRRQALAALARYRNAGRRAPLERGAPSRYPRADLAWLALRGWPAALTAWLEFVTPFLRWRLARALGSPSPRTLDPVNDLARLPARLYVTDTHIDVVAGIESIRMPVRVAGLDRSPGWVGRLLRVVLFHFE